MIVKFGLQQNSFTFLNRRKENVFRDAATIAKTAEDTGFDSFWFMDHLLQYPSVDPETEPLLEGWTSIAAMASLTRRVKLGVLATCNLFRHPSLLAKMSATVDVISNGRLIMGIGAGWYEGEHVAYGIPFYPVGERLDRLEEAINVLKVMWTEEQATVIGRYYQVKDALCSPKPIQRPHPPLLVAGAGEKKTLRIVARHADLWNLPNGAPAEARRKLDLLKQYCAEAGRDYEAITKSSMNRVVIGKTPQEVEGKLAHIRARGLPLLVQSITNTALIGTPQQIRDQLRLLVDLGLTYFIVSFPDADDLTPIHLFATEVMPAFR